MAPDAIQSTTEERRMAPKRSIRGNGKMGCRGVVRRVIWVWTVERAAMVLRESCVRDRRYVS